MLRIDKERRNNRDKLDKFSEDIGSDCIKVEERCVNQI